jgi:hypothetical protein
MLFADCVLCGERHHSNAECPCPQCHEVHRGSICFNRCSFCNRHHEGQCKPPYSNRCRLCGESHQPFVACPCPRCLYRHGSADCHSVEEWSLYSRNGTFELLVGDRCLQCGELHDHHLSCPCALCLTWHVDSICLPICAASAEAVDSADKPCQRCHVWHGSDVCQRSAVGSSQGFSKMRLPRALMMNRAVADASSSAAGLAAVAPAHSDAASDSHDVGSMTISCTYCHARFWVGEKIQCCYEGSLIIPEPSIPQSLSDIILSSTVRSHIRSYNMAMAMASVGHTKCGFPDGVFTISGKSYHRIGTMTPAAGQLPSFAQIYTVDTNDATDRRSAIFGDRLNKSVLNALHDHLVIHNRCVTEFRRVAASDVHELVWSSDDNIMGMQMGALVASAGTKRSIVIQRYGVGNSLQFIDDGHALYHTLTYPLLFPTGSSGWFSGMTRGLHDGSTQRVTLHDYGRYMLMHRDRSADAATSIVKFFMSFSGPLTCSSASN